MRAEQQRLRRAFREIEVKRVHVVADRMELGDVERFEIVVRRFDLRAFDDGEADGEENIFDLLEDLANEMVRAKRTDDSGQREVDALASACAFFRAGFDDFAALFDF